MYCCGSKSDEASFAGLTIPFENRICSLGESSARRGSTIHSAAIAAKHLTSIHFYPSITKGKESR